VSTVIVLTVTPTGAGLSQFFLYIEKCLFLHSHPCPPPSFDNIILTSIIIGPRPESEAIEPKKGTSAS
jgi:hypothetical protein